MTEPVVPPQRAALRAAITSAWLADESQALDRLLPPATLSAECNARVEQVTRELVGKVRARRGDAGLVQAFLREYDLSSQEGVVLMCLAEALLRVPDAATADRLISDKIAPADWEAHVGNSASWLVNASTWGLILTGKIVRLDDAQSAGSIKTLIARSGEPVIRAALKRAMGILAEQFVMGRGIEQALERCGSADHARYRHSFDMLGEAALSNADAERFFAAYQSAIAAIARSINLKASLHERPGISIKLSALHPRYDVAHRDRVMRELVPRLAALADQAARAGMTLTVDAEEAERLELSLDVFEQVLRRSEYAQWHGFGLAVQAYQKRALPLLHYLAALARELRRRIPLRLVKGAYWDSEIKRAQERGLDGYPVFTRKAATDVSYLACARALLDAPDAFYPQFATHNARTIASVLELAKGAEFEFQRLHGMGEALYDAVLKNHPGACRVYAPVGSHEDLLPYLVRRLLENGANTSFVNRIEDEHVSIDELVADPVAHIAALASRPHPRIPLPAQLYGAARVNSRGINLHDDDALRALTAAMDACATQRASAAPLLDGKSIDGATREVRNPTNRADLVGTVAEATPGDAQRALEIAADAAPRWNATHADARADALARAGNLFEQRAPELITLLVREAGKTIPDALAEVREAVDYCRYYALQARAQFARPITLPGPAGESNELSLHGRGVFACISPWNFPLAIFTGQIVAALAAGNAVIAKPARAAPLIGMRAVRLLHEAGVPAAALQFLPGSGAVVGGVMLKDRRLGGVAFTGSTDTATWLQQALAARGGPIVPLIAETGGLNVMIADSTALPEQVVLDAMQSAFNSAGQRCSALRVLFVQNDVAERVIRLLREAMGELVIGDPRELATDVGPVIGADARDALHRHVQQLAGVARELRTLELPAATQSGTFFAPRAYEIDSLDVLQREVFGPVLHVARYAGDRLDAVIDAVNRSGYGLTLGVHSRVADTARRIAARARVGNVYVNRNMIGAVVGVQPFGGEGLSGTGPKAGGPHYLLRFATERTLTINTAAVGGNTTLVSLREES
jgi:RHH-type proline utilization regulon transcriptional repressor/proline dehydrogenase/delta 1-pyrroline-5-carboxylate dehydrogenase